MTTRSYDLAATSAARTALLALARLLGTVGVLPARSDNLMDNVLATYALPCTSPTPQEGRRLTRLALTLSGRRDIAVPVHLRDTVKVPRLPRVSTSDTLADFARGGTRSPSMVPHGPFARPAAPKAKSIEEVWFRRARCDITGGSGACWRVPPKRCRQRRTAALVVAAA